MKQLATLVIVVASSIFGGFIFSKMWGWFVVSKFGLPALSTGEAMGLIATVSWFTASLSFAMAKKEARAKSKSDEATFDLWWALLVACVVYPMALGMGYLLHVVTR